MTKFDVSQQQVLDLDATQHARVLGAPGSGKTMLLIEAFARVSETPSWVEGDVLVLAANRLVAASLRRSLELRLQRPLGVTPVRTAASLAFALLQSHAASEGSPNPRLLTGTAQDEMFAAVLEQQATAASNAAGGGTFAPEVLRSEAFRGELRNLNRILDDFALHPAELIARLEHDQDESGGVTSEALAQWRVALRLIEVANQRLSRERPDELTSSAMLRAASELVKDEASLTLPRLVMVDDAGELSEGALALLAALSERGVAVWAFGDPDVATSAFQGEHTAIMAGVHRELQRRVRRHHRVNHRDADEQVVVLERVYRHGEQIRGCVKMLTERIGAAGAGQQRQAIAESDDAREVRSNIDSVRFATAATEAEQVGAVAHRFRVARLGLARSTPVPWSQMAVICRSRSEVKRISRILAAHQVPSSVAAGGVVLREHQLVRELIRLLQHALEISPLSPREVIELLGGVVGGLDPISLRRLRGALRLQEVRSAEEDARAALGADALLFEAFQFPGDRPVLDMRAARRLQRLGRLARAAVAVHRAGGTPRETLWQIWEGSELADNLQQQALATKGTRSDDAHRALDAVVGLFFALQRHEEQDNQRPIAAILEELLISTVPEDSLAARSEREVVTVTTPQGVIGREFEMVCVVGLQDGTWPNLRSRGSLLGVSALERWLRGGPAVGPSRRDTVHDELRLLAHSAARAKSELLVMAVANDEQHPSPFYSLGQRYKTEGSLPSSRITLRGVVAEMRRRLVQDVNDVEARDSLVALAREGVAGAHPDEWYGVTLPSSDTPLSDIEHDPVATVHVSPSQMERAETCPLDWIVSRLGGDTSNFRTNIGTLLHEALETATAGITADELFDRVKSEWGNLQFEAKWQSDRALIETEAMSVALAAYLDRFDQSQRELLANEATFEVPIDFARLRGTVDRIEAESRGDGTFEITVVDLKTGRTKPAAKDVPEHAQLLAYQLGVRQGAFARHDGERISESVGGAKLLYVHPNTLGKTQAARGERYTEIEQTKLDAQAQAIFEARVREVARVMAASHFTAQLEHHCADPYAPSRACALHIIPPVSHA